MKALRALLLLALVPLALGRLVVTYQDAALTHLPARTVVADELRAGRIPFVQPGASCGQPLAGNPNFGLFFPDTLLALLLPVQVAFGLRFALVLLLGFVGARRWARAEGIPREGAEIAALAFVLSGVFLSAWRFFNSGLALAIAPWVLAAAAKLAARTALGHMRSARKAVAELGLWGGLEVLAGEPVIALLVFAMAAAHAVANRLRRPWLRPHVAATVVRVLAGFALAALIAAPQIAATAQILGDSSRERKPIPFVTATGTSVHPVRLLEQAIPFPYGRPDLRGPEGFSGQRFFDNHTPYLWTLHLGLVVLALLALHGAAGRETWGCALMAIGAGALSLGRFLPGAKVLYPLLSLGGRIRFPVKWWYVVALALVPLVGDAASRWASGARPGRWRTGLLVALLVAAAVALVVSWPTTLLAVAGPVLSLVLTAALLSRERRPSMLAWALAGSLLVSALPLLLALVDVPPPMPPRLASGRVYWRVELDSAPVTVEDSATAPTVRELMRRASPELWPLVGTEQGLGYAFDADPDGAYADEDRAIRKAIDALSWPDRAPELRVAGVTTVITDGAPPLPYRESAVLNAAEGIRLYTLDRAASSVRVATRTFHAPDLLAVLAIHRDRAFDLRTDVVLDGTAERPSGAAASSAILTSRETPGTLVSEVEVSADAVVVWSRTFLSAWWATVDEQPAAILRADGHLVGVRVTPGRHHVAIGWRRWPVVTGLALSALGLALAATAAWAWPRRAVAPRSPAAAPPAH